MQHSTKNNTIFTTSNLTKIAVLSGIAYVLSYISFPIPMLFVPFLKVDASDLPALLGGLALGPIPGMIIVFMKNLLQVLTGASTTGGVGEFANFLIGGSYVLVISLIYRYKKSLSSVILGLVLGTIAMTIAGCIANYYIILPAYELVGWTTESVVDMGRLLNSRIDDKLSFIIWMIAPFNIFKGTVTSILTLMMYKKSERFLSK